MGNSERSSGIKCRFPDRTPSCGYHHGSHEAKAEHMDALCYFINTKGR